MGWLKWKFEGFQIKGIDDELSNEINKLTAGA